MKQVAPCQVHRFQTVVARHFCGRLSLALEEGATQMSFWKRVFGKSKNVDDYDIQRLLTRGYCRNCGTCLLSKDVSLCPQCGHDQRAPIAKKITNPHDMATAAISYGSSCMTGDDSKAYVEDLIRAYGQHLEQARKNQLLNVLLLSDLAITSIVYFARYEANPKQDEIVESFKELLDDYLLHAYGKEDFQETREYLVAMVTEYAEAFEAQDWLQSLSKMLQCRAESVILGLPSLGQNFAIPSIHAFMKYFVHISSFLPPLQATLNKWEIE